MIVSHWESGWNKCSNIAILKKWTGSIRIQSYFEMVCSQSLNLWHSGYDNYKPTPCFGVTTHSIDYFTALDPVQGREHFKMLIFFSDELIGGKNCPQGGKRTWSSSCKLQMGYVQEGLDGLVSFHDSSCHDEGKKLPSLSYERQSVSALARGTSRCSGVILNLLQPLTCLCAHVGWRLKGKRVSKNSSQLKDQSSLFYSKIPWSADEPHKVINKGSQSSSRILCSCAQGGIAALIKASESWKHVQWCGVLSAPMWL